MLTEPYVYTPPARWLTCSSCGSMWTGFEAVPCWACGGSGLPSRSPCLTSQHGYAPVDFDDERPTA